ncbi:MAG TPA: type II CAAX endopeptidase family protein [Terriglobales bacterium]
MTTIASDAPESTNRWRDSRWLILAEFAVFALIWFADVYHWHHVIKINKTLYLLVLGWASLRIRGMRWKDIGFQVYRTWPRTIAIGVLCGVGIEAMELFITQPLLVRLTHKWPNLAEFAALRWNWKLLALALLFTWTLAAIGEEFVYRGYLMNRVADLFGRTRLAWILSLVVVSVIFGFAHIYQGVTGVTENAIDGFILGLMYLRCDRKLSVPIIAHGITDTVDFLLIFMGKYPGM